MPVQTLSPQEAATLLSILRGAAGRLDGIRARATKTLTAIAGDAVIPNVRYVGVVKVNDGGVPELVCGEVALVNIESLKGPDNPTEPAEIDELATRLDTDLGEDVCGLVEELRELAHSHRVEDLEQRHQTGRCTAEQLDAALQSAELEPSEVTVAQATVTGHGG